jgi:hypothetical protein
MGGETSFSQGHSMKMVTPKFPVDVNNMHPYKKRFKVKPGIIGKNIISHDCFLLQYVIILITC